MFNINKKKNDSTCFPVQIIPILSSIFFLQLKFMNKYQNRIYHCLQVNESHLTLIKHVFVMLQQLDILGGSFKIETSMCIRKSQLLIVKVFSNVSRAFQDQIYH